jgi:hypothetical protein
MISIRIFQALLRPFVAHPLYQRWGVWDPTPLPSVLNSRWYRLRRWYQKHELRVITGIVLFSILLMFIFGFWRVMSLILFVPIFLMVLLVPLSLLLLGTINGLLSGFAINQTIVNEKIQGRYDLLGLTPYGFEGSTWALCSLSLQGKGLLRRLRNLGRALYAFLFALTGFPLVYAMLLAAISPYPNALQEVINGMGVSFVLSFLLGLDYIQSTNVGCIIGMVAPTFDATHTGSRNFLLSMFLAVQFGTYVFIAIIVFFFISGLVSGLSLPLAALVGVFVTYILREMMVIALWRWMAYRLHANLKDLDRLAHVGIGNQSIMSKLFVSLLRLVQRERPKVI